MANQPTYQKFTVESKKDPSSNTYSIASYDKDLRAFKEAVRSAMPKDSFFYFDEKDFGKQGKLTVDIYTHQEDASLVNKALKEKSSQLLYKGSLDEKYRAVKHRVGLTPEEIERVSKIEAMPVNKQQEQEEKQARKEAEKEARDRMGAMLKLFGLITVLTDITRRILTSVLDFSKGTLEAGRNARNLGTSYAVAREASILETAHGLPQGTITGAMGDIQKMFGNITNLDESALGALALVMGSDIESLVKSGIGGDRPEELLGAILNSYMDRANKGYNSLGQYVGQEDARRELYSQLLKISPQIASLFATMQDERNNINSIYRSQFDTFEEWKRLMSTNRGGLYESQFGLVETTAQLSGLVNSLIMQLKESIKITLSAEVLKLLEHIANSRIFMTEAEKWEKDIQNREANSALIKRIDEQLASFPDEGLNPKSPNITPEQRANIAYREALLGIKKRAVKQNEKNYDVADVASFMTLPRIEEEARKLGEAYYKEALGKGLEGSGVKRPYGFDVMWEVIKAHKVPSNVIEKERDKLIKWKANEERKAKKEAYNEAVKEAKKADKEGGLYYHSALVNAGWETKSVDENYRVTYTPNLDLTEEEMADIESLYAGENKSLADLIFLEFSKKYGLTLSAERAGVNAITAEVMNSKAFASSLVPSEEVVKTIIESTLKSGENLAVGSYRTFAIKDRDGYKIVLDINHNGEPDVKDLTLFTATGSYSGYAGKLDVVFDVDKDKIIKKNMQSTSASSEK